jgi:hypothetical protein
MRRIRSRMSLAALVVPVALALAASTTYAQKTVTAVSGTTNVTLDSSFLSALSSLGVAPGVVQPTMLNGATVNFPITGGAVDLDTGIGQLTHSGGLTLTAGSTVATLQTFIIDSTGPMPVVTGLVVVNGKMAGRLPLFDLHAPPGTMAPLHLMDGMLNLNGFWITLDPMGAAALNHVFHITALKGGMQVGTVQVSAQMGAYW